MKVINLFAPPGTGKTATGQILSGLLSVADYKVEYIPEFAKFATLSQNTAALSDQIYMFAKQENRLNVLKDADLDFVVMDGPLPIALLFTPPNYYSSYERLVMEVFNSYDNVNYYLRRNPSLKYKTHGRNESESEALNLDAVLRGLLGRNGVTCVEHMVEKSRPEKLFNELDIAQ
jgi:hypothetical protein